MGKNKRSGYLHFRIVILVSTLILALSASQFFIRETFQDNHTDPPEFPDTDLASFLDDQYVLIPAGEFTMGSDLGRRDEEPAHPVYLDAFYLDRYEITNLQYRRFLLQSQISPPSYWANNNFPPGQELQPVVGVRWVDANAYCAWAGKRLPTEAEWEKACRGTDGLIYPWGDQPAQGFANSKALPGGPQPEMWDQIWDFLQGTWGTSSPALTPVGSYPSGTSPYGIHDLIGNAAEWTADYYNWDGYGQMNRINPLVTEPAWNHVVRGSAWIMPYGNSLGGFDLNRCSMRSSSHGDTRDARIGFRCAFSILKD